MTPIEIQKALNKLGASPALKVDGEIGRKSLKAVDLLLAKDIYAKPRYSNWEDTRRLVAVEQIFYRGEGIEVGLVDGRVGPQTLYARNVYAARLRGDPTEETWRDKDESLARPNYVPPKNSTIWPTQAGVPKFFGNPGTNLVTMEFPYPMVLAWDPDVVVKHTSCHKKVAEPMRRVFENALKVYGHKAIVDLRLNRFGGLFNKRKVRGGSRWSMHAYGIACDIDPDRNQLKWNKSKATLDEKVYEPWWKIVEAEGAISLGRERDYDWMHFQFARL